MRSFELHLSLPEALERAYAEDAPQKDHLCGAFWGALALRSAGITLLGGQRIDQDLVAKECGTTLEDGDPYASLPTGAEPRLDYRISLPTNPDPATSGTSASALREAIERCGQGTLLAVPVRGPWSEQTLIALFRTVSQLSPGPFLIANWRTGKLWGSRPDPALLLAYLAGEVVSGPRPEWDVGHFVALLFAIAHHERAVIGVLDTYPTLGWKGHHIQPGEAVAAALNRDDGREGGVLCVCQVDHHSRLHGGLKRLGFELNDWDNGSVRQTSANEGSR
jgi:hypothetical protein